MNEQQLVTFGALGAAVIVGVVLVSKQTTSSFATDPGQAATDNTIIAANTQAIQTGASLENSMIAAATSLATVHDNNQTTLAIAANNGATQVQLQKIAAGATLASASLGAAASVANTITNANAQGMSEYYAALTSSGAQAASVTENNTNAQASTHIAALQGLNATNVANANATAQETIAQTQAQTQKTLSSNSMWGNIVSSLVGGATSFFTSGASSLFRPSSGTTTLGQTLTNPVAGSGLFDLGINNGSLNAPGYQTQFAGQN